jgi:bifunctional UDP-N-acetylglucosamine pyrophosphorylase/glucosamine-1-phosphate N-acetyltransferase
MAAGDSARVGGGGEKPLLPLAGRPLLSHILEAARKAGAKRIHIVAAKKNLPRLQAAIAGDGDIRWVIQARPRGTADAVLCALSGIADNTAALALCADTPLLRAADLRRVAKAAIDSGSPAILSAVSDAPHGYGRIIRDTDGRIIDIAEEAALQGAQRDIVEINAGAIAAKVGFLRKHLPQIPAHTKTGERYLTALIKSAAQAGFAARAVAIAAAADAAGVNTLSQLALVERRWQTRAAEALTKRGVILADASRLIIRGRATVGRGAFIDANVILGGEVSIGANAAIGANCVIEDAKIGACARVLPFCHLQGCAVAAAAEVGPFARLRPGAKIGRGAKVGNFVEVKNTALGAGAKANHLAYLGDAAVGENANIGAGVVTCNYDGARKHKTRIKAGAFVGSGVNLVAPLAVGKNAYIAAGSTVVNDAPADKLTIARARQVVKPRLARGGKK